MADVVNVETLELRQSVNTPNYPNPPWLPITRDLFLAWSVIPQIYRKWVVDHIEEMSAGEKAAVDAAILEALRDSVIQQVDELENIQRAFMLAVLDELNNHTAKINAMLTAVDTASNTAEIKANYGAIPDLPTRTTAQLRSAIRAKLGT